MGTKSPPASASSSPTTPPAPCWISPATSTLRVGPSLLYRTWSRASGGSSSPSWGETRGSRPRAITGAGVPYVHLQRRREPCGIDGASLLVAETTFSYGSGVPVARAREVVLAAVQSLLPFIERHYLIVDSPHDGRPLWDLRSGRRKEIDRGALRASGGTPDAEPMTARWHVETPGLHGLSAEPIRSPLGGAFVVGPSALPALGQEGELLAAWGAARMVTRTDKRRERMRREMWSKIELG